MTTTYEIIKIVPAGKYEGYIWMSNEPEPEVVHTDTVHEAVELTEGKNPFIIEAQLLDRSLQKSYSIRFADGKYVALCYDLKKLHDMGNVEVTHHKYVANRMGDEKWIHFREYWHSQPDPNCANMKVLQPVEFVFTGFNDKTE